MITLRVAWRNLWRNRGRTGITLAAMALSTAVMILTYALMLGMITDMEKSVVAVFTGQVQVHNRAYASEHSLYDTIARPQAILDKARSSGIAASARAFGFGLVSSGPNSAGVQFWGVNPQAERSFGKLDEALLEGAFLPDAPGMRVVLGRKLARTLGAKVGTELVVVVQAADGSLGNDLLHVCGILKGVGENLDRSLALIHEQDFAALFVFPGRYHEIALNSHGRMTPEDVASFIKGAAGPDEVKTWRQLMPGVSDMLNSFDGFSLIFEVVFFLIAGLGVMNTLLMSTYERIPEFGLLKAIGTTPWRILREVSAEALILGIFSSSLGGVLGACAAWYLSRNPIDLSSFAEGFSTSGVMMSARWGAQLTVAGIFWPIVFMWLVSVVAALYPAVKAARLDPVRALSHV